MRRAVRIKQIGILVLGLLAAPVVLTIRATKQEQRDQRLIAAIQNGAKAEQVVSLLAQGADPNARAGTRTDGSFWQQLLALFRKRKENSADQPTAMQLAVRRDLADDKFAHLDDNYAIIAALRRRGATDVADPRAMSASLAWAERLLASIPEPPLKGDLADSHRGLDDLEEAFKDILAKYGPAVRTYAGLARCRARMSRYEATAHAVRLALLWSPSNPIIEVLLAQTDRLAEVRRSITRLLPAGNTVIRIQPYPSNAGPERWAILYGRHQGEDYDRDYEQVHLALYAEQGRSYRLLCRSNRLIDSQFPDNRGDIDGFDHLSLYVCRLTGNRLPEILVHEVSPGGTWIPSHVDLFTLHNNRLARILDLSSSQPLWLEDLRHNGTYQVRNVYEIGAHIFHAAQPRWSDIYAYKRDRFVLADGDYPEQFAQWPARLRETLKRFPDDPEILGYLKVTDAILAHRPIVPHTPGQTTHEGALLAP
jgi:hypothetical protein